MREWRVLEARRHNQQETNYSKKKIFSRSVGVSIVSFAMACSMHSVTAKSEEKNLLLSQVGIRRTTDGIPHINAASWKGLGVGVGYAQAQDALCTLAEAFVTYAGKRSFYWGADSQSEQNTTLGKHKNIDLDIFFRAYADENMVAEYQRQQPEELKQLIEGFAEGYNHYLRTNVTHANHSTQSPCIGQAWVKEISAADIYRRMFAANIGAGYARFISEISNAQPSTVASSIPKISNFSSATQGETIHLLQAKLESRIGDTVGLGSNMIALGSQATGEKGSVLFGNPHWFWGGPDRFYQAHLTIPGKINVAGVSFLGIPVIMVGFNEQIAWSHTVSEARRFGLFDLKLEPDQPTRYSYDGKSESMQTKNISVEVRQNDGTLRTIERKLYSSRFGPIIELSHPKFRWGKAHAVAIRDINANNFRVFRNFFYWGQARSLDEFIAIQRREVAVPWTNTSAIGKGDGRVWYSDIGAVPNVPDSLRTQCTTALAQSFASLDALTPFLDGSRSHCEWVKDKDAVQLGAMPAHAMPHLLRHDYVANMNDSYWLTNPQQPLEGFPKTLGGERQLLSLRGRYGHHLAYSLVHSGAHSSLQLSQTLQREVLSSRAYSADQFKTVLLKSACRYRVVTIPKKFPSNMQAVSLTNKRHINKVNVQEACRILRRWPNTASIDNHGSILWDAFWKNVMDIPDIYSVPFSERSPLDTPKAPDIKKSKKIAHALAVAVTEVLTHGKLDAPLSTRQYARGGNSKIHIYGGYGFAGYFTVACSKNNYLMDKNAEGNSYLQVVRFNKEGVIAHTLLSHGQADSALKDEGESMSALQRYARKDWLTFPFSEGAIARDVVVSEVLQLPISEQK